MVSGVGFRVAGLDWRGECGTGGVLGRQGRDESERGPHEGAATGRHRRTAEIDVH